MPDISEDLPLGIVARYAVRLTHLVPKGRTCSSSGACASSTGRAIKIAMADGPLTGPERAVAGHLATALGMTQAQAIGVIALTEQNAGLN
jgi:hypothetical protein